MDGDLKNIIIKLKNLKKPILEKYKAEIIALFGSYVRGDQAPGSDLDIIARFGEGTTLIDVAGLNDYLREQLDISVDIVSERAVREELKEKIFGEAVLL